MATKLVLCALMLVLIARQVNNQQFDPELFEIVEELRPHCADDEHYTVGEPGEFPTCVNYGTVSAINCDPLKCPPGYYCKPGSSRNTCTVDAKSCAVWYYKIADAKNYYQDAKKWKPTCSNDDLWEPKQCKGEKANGMCFCYSPNGERIFGQQFSRLAEDMTCACSAKKWEMEQKLDPVTTGRPYVSLHCDKMGNYEPLQCDSGLCWCVEPKTGQLTAPVVPDDMMKFLPCYVEIDIGMQYLRQCESHLYSENRIKYELQLHGTNFNNFPPLLCDADGSYGKYKVLNGLIFCTWRDNSNIGSWAGELNNINVVMDCNCARDSKVYEEMGLTQTLQCMPTGNYQSPQMINLKYHCVDSDGFVTTDEGDVATATSKCEKFK